MASLAVPHEYWLPGDGVPDCGGGDLREMDLPGGKKKIPD